MNTMLPIRNARGDWEIRQEFPVTPTTVLEVVTMRRSSGALMTTAALWTLTHGNLKTRGGSDFLRTLLTQSHGRVTAKQVAFQHEEALHLVPAVLEELKCSVSTRPI